MLGGIINRKRGNLSKWEKISLKVYGSWYEKSNWKMVYR